MFLFCRWEPWGVVEAIASGQGMWELQDLIASCGVKAGCGSSEMKVRGDFRSLQKSCRYCLVIPKVALLSLKVADDVECRVNRLRVQYNPRLISAELHQKLAYC